MSGVWKRGWTCAKAFGRKRSRPKAKRMRGELRISLVMKPKAEMLAPASIRLRPGSPRKRDAASRQRRGGKLPEGVSQNSLRDQLDQQVEHGRDRKREVDCARNGARRILHLAARHERDFNPDESEKQEQDTARPRHGAPGQVIARASARLTKNIPTPTKISSGTSFSDRHNPDRAGAGSNAADIYPGERSENEQNDQKMGACRGRRPEPSRRSYRRAESTTPEEARIAVRK